MAVEFRRRRRIDATIDMTPMIDTLLQLFVVFLLSMSFIASAVRLELPRATVNQALPDTPVVVGLDASGATFLNNEAVARQELSGRLGTLFQQGAKREVVLRADRALAYSKILETLVEIQRGGAANILLAYEHEEGP
jgi:biopolymer transport protein TolR